MNSFFQSSLEQGWPNPVLESLNPAACFVALVAGLGSAHRVLLFTLRLAPSPAGFNVVGMAGLGGMYT